jgi:hypothetical protein
VRGPISADVTAGFGQHESQRQLNQRDAGSVGYPRSIDRRAHASRRAWPRRDGRSDRVRVLPANLSATASDWYLPVNHPPFSGAQTNTPTSC